MNAQLNRSAEGKAPGRTLYGYDRSVYKVIAFACILIVFSMLLTGTLGYWFTKKEAVDKLKSQDLITIAKSIAGQVEARIERAMETSVILAEDPLVQQWVKGGETDRELEAYALQKLRQLNEKLGYSNAFVVSGMTNRYWAESGRVIDTVSATDPDDSWFFETMKSKQKVSVQFDYNSVLRDTFAFIDVLVGEPEKPLAVAGVGLSLHELSREFQTYKYGDGSNVWLVNGDGEVLLSDQEWHNGRNLGDFVPAPVKELVTNSFKDNARVMEIEDGTGELADVISYPLRSTELRLLVLIQRSETVSFLATIKNNTILAIVISVISIVFMFYFISNRLANPYQRALALNQELEQVVSHRTRELALRNEEIMDSIGYAQRIQETVLPSREQMEGLLGECAVIWKPKDVVGGDFYWVRPYGQGCLVGIGDCTGHGVPGAFMTMLAVSMLDRIIEQEGLLTPDEILGALNRMLKSTLNQEERGGKTDDGLDLGLCYVSGSKLAFAGAGCSLFIRENGRVSMLEGDRRSIGYRKTPSDFRFELHELEGGRDIDIYIATDGLFDQNGGDKGHSYGKSRFTELLARLGGLPLSRQGEQIRRELEEYQGEAPQRDDMTLIAFRPNQIR